MVMGFRVKDFRVKGFRVKGLGLRVSGLGVGAMSASIFVCGWVNLKTRSPWRVMN